MGGGSLLGTPNPTAIGFFLAFVALTLGITWWAARHTRTTEEFFAAGRRITGRQNGFALAGDYMSAASFLGIAGLVSTSGFDGLIYSTGWLVGWPVVLFLIAEPLRNLGRYTFADVVSFRLRQTPGADCRRDRRARGGVAVPDRADGRRRQPDQADVRPVLRDRDRHRRRGDAGLRAVRRHDRHHLGADRQGGAAAWRRSAARGAGAGAVRLQPVAAVRGSCRKIRRRRAGAGQAGFHRPGRGLARPRADVRHRGPAAHPDALLHRARCTRRARVGVLGHRPDRLVSTC